MVNGRFIEDFFENDVDLSIELPVPQLLILFRVLDVRVVGFEPHQFLLLFSGIMVF